MKYGIIGAGKVGRALAIKLHSKGLLNWLIKKNRQNETDIFADMPIFCELNDKLSSVDCVIIAVRDDQIEELSRYLAGNIDQMPNFQYVFHVSGIKDTSELYSLESIGKVTFAMHPMQTFGVYRDDLLDNVFWGIDCKDNFYEFAEQAVSDLSGIPYRLPESLLQNKGAYHAIGVAAANFVQSSVEFAKILTENAKLPSMELLPKILQTAFSNVLNSISSNEEFPITGPIARADIQTIAKHIESLSDSGILRDIYINQSKSLAELCLLREIISQEQYDGILLKLNDF